MSRRSAALVPLLIILLWHMEVRAQETGAVPDVDLYGPPPPTERCTEEQEAAIISGEIIVCRRIIDQSEHRYSDDDEAETRYAQEKERMGEFGLPASLPADFVGPGIFKGKATVGGLCLIGPCPPPTAVLIDLEAIPEAPPGSDADRVARGLVPVGNERGDQPAEILPDVDGSENPAAPAS